MSFLNMKDPSKRDKLVAEYIKTKNKIQNDFRSERLGEQTMYEDFGKIFKPIPEQQKKSSEEIDSNLAPLQEAIEDMPLALPWDLPQPEMEEQPEALPAHDDEPPPLIYGPLASKYLRNFATDDADKRHGLKDRNGQFYLGYSKVDIVGENIKIGDAEYQGTEGLWNLLMMDEPDKTFLGSEDFKNYKDMLIRTDAIRNPTSKRIKPLEILSDKWRNFINPIWFSDEAKVKRGLKIRKKGQKRKKGSGTSGQGFLPSDANALCERLELLMASKQAGNTGVRNEIANICDELLRQKILSRDAYKNLILALNKDVNF